MGKGSKILLAGALGLVVCFVIAAALVRAQSQTPPAAPAPQTAGQRFKNIQVLKDIPADQLDSTMDFIADSLGVRCGYCHVKGDFSKDDKRPKLAARKMIRMELAIDKANFNGRPEVTCYTCHRGLTHPVGAPVIGAAGAATPAAEIGSVAANPAPTPTPDQVLQKYVDALGGADAAAKITSRVAKGTFTGPDGKSAPLDLFAKAPGKLLLVLHTPSGSENRMVYDGIEGWGGNARHVGPLRGSLLEVMETQAKLAFAGDLKQSFGRLRMSRPEQVGGQEAYVLFAAARGGPPVKLCFNEQSGLLLRVETFVRTPLGMDPTAVDYSDYRKADGVKVPYRWTIGSPQYRRTIQLDDVEQNTPVDDSMFARPAKAATAGGPSR